MTLYSPFIKITIRTSLSMQRCASCSCRSTTKFVLFVNWFVVRSRPPQSAWHSAGYSYRASSSAVHQHHAARSVVRCLRAGCGIQPDGRCCDASHCKLEDTSSTVASRRMACVMAYVAAALRAAACTSFNACCGGSRAGVVLRTPGFRPASDRCICASSIIGMIAVVTTVRHRL